MHKRLGYSERKVSGVCIVLQM